MRHCILVGISERLEGTNLRTTVIRAIPRRLLITHLRKSLRAHILHILYVLFDKVNFVLLGNVVRVSHLKHVLEPDLVRLVRGGVGTLVIRIESIRPINHACCVLWIDALTRGRVTL